ncbi:MAG: hypothetical protein K2X66_16115 [Cyanobacteria bacterium]|nr:hypothetical protein [Cyanobacteriota bacterium]
MMVRVHPKHATCLVHKPGGNQARSGVLPFQKNANSAAMISSRACLKFQGSEPVNKKRKFFKWVLSGMPLIHFFKPTDPQETQPKTQFQKVKKFFKDRIPLTVLAFTSVCGGFGAFYAVGGKTQNIIPPAPSAVMQRNEHPSPWPDSVKIYASVPQQDLSLNKIGGGGVFLPQLMSSLEKTGSLEKAFETLEKGYGQGLNIHYPVQSSGGASIFNSADGNKSRSSLIISGGGLKDNNEDISEESKKDFFLTLDTLKALFPNNHNSHGLIQPTIVQFKTKLKKIADENPDELLIVIAAEGSAVIDYKIPLKGRSKEGGLEAGFQLNNYYDYDETSFKKLISTLFAGKKTKIAIVADFCHSGALIE